MALTAAERPVPSRPAVTRSRTTAVRERVAAGALPLATTATVTLLVGGPLLFMIFASFRGMGSVLPFSPRAVTTLSNYTEILDADLLATLWDTAVFVGGSLAVALGFGIPLAWLLERTDLPFRRLLTLFLFAPLLIPPITNAQIWSVLLAPETGLFNEMLRLVIPVDRGPIVNVSAVGIVFAQGTTYVPLAALFVGTALRNIDAPLEEASRLSGASAMQTFRRVTAPLLLPSILNTALMVGVFLLGQFEIPLVFGVGEGLRPIGITIYNALKPAASVPLYGQIAAYSVLTTAVSYVLILAYGRVTKGAEKYATVTGKGHRSRTTSLGRGRWPVFLLVSLWLGLTVGLRVLILAWQSVVPFLGEVRLSVLLDTGSLDGYRRIFDDPNFWSSARLTMVLALLSAAITTVLGLVMAWVVARHRGRAGTRTALDLLASSSLGIPAPVAGFAFLLLFLAVSRWVPLYGSVGALVVAYCFRLGLAYRVASSAMAQLGTQLEEASFMSGAGLFATFRRIILPLLAPTVVVLMVLGMVTAVQEFTVPLFLSTTGDQPVSVYTYNLLATQQTAAAAAVGIVTLLAVLLMAAAAGALSSRWRTSAS